MEVELLYTGEKFAVYYIKSIKANVVAVYSGDMDEANKKQFL